MTAPKERPGEPPRTPNPEPRLRPSEERVLARGRTTRRIAVAALAVAVVGLGLAAWRLVVPSGGSGCQEQAWDVRPEAANLPMGWAITASQYDVGRQQMTLLGPAPEDEVSTQAVVYATITCFPDGAADAVTRSADAATAAGQAVTERTDLGDQAFAAVDPSGARFIQLRDGPVVVYLAASGDAMDWEVDGVASAFDLAMGGDGAAALPASPDTGAVTPTDEAPIDEPSEDPAESAAPAAPELVAALPTTVGDVELAVDSAIGTDVLSDDQGSRAIAAALREAGKGPGDLRIAQAYDANGATDLTILAVRVEGMGIEALTELVLDSWLAASGAGVGREETELGGRAVTRIDYGDEGSVSYLVADGDIVRVVETADADLAAQAVAALP